MPEHQPPATPTLLSKIVHDLNQPLSAINNYAQAGVHMIDNGLTDPGKLKELFGKIASQCSRATLLSQELGKAVKAPTSAKDAT